MKYVPNGPLERALALGDLSIIKPASQSTTKLFVVVAISLIVGGSFMYFFMKRRNKNQEANTVGNT